MLIFLTSQSNTTIRSQIASLGDSSLSSWVANSNFLVTLAFGPVFVSPARPAQHSRGSTCANNGYQIRAS